MMLHVKEAKFVEALSQ